MEVHWCPFAWERPGLKASDVSGLRTSPVGSRKPRTGKLKEFYKTQLKKTAAPPQSALKKQKVKGEAVPQRNYSHLVAEMMDFMPPGGIHRL